MPKNKGMCFTGSHWICPSCKVVSWIENKLLCHIPLCFWPLHIDLKPHFPPWFLEVLLAPSPSQGIP